MRSVVTRVHEHCDGAIDQAVQLRALVAELASTPDGDLQMMGHEREPLSAGVRLVLFQPPGE